MSKPDNNLRELEEITPAERLLVWRRRHGLSQEALAQQWGVSMRTLLGWEYGTREAVPKLPVLPLGNGEVCFLYRRRAKVKLSKVASDIGVTAYWVTQMERGRANPQSLLEYWEC